MRLHIRCYLRRVVNYLLLCVFRVLFSEARVSQYLLHCLGLLFIQQSR